ncbi:MAG: [citrate (pro-3S)-lyase] ligase [Salinivirgaceae bacterium]|nr:MAG: [citrate (pro-3S)-lyase] ligase [Salinivirgaceae bacterium]
MSFENADFREEVLDISNPYDVKFVSEFLAKLDFEYNEYDVDYTMVLYNLNEEIIGTGSFKKHILKYVAVAPKFRNTIAFSQIVTHLMDKLLLEHKHIFVYTLPRNTELFQGLGFTEIATAPPLFSVLEFGYENIKTYQDYIRKSKIETSSRPVSALVVNCNPFTNGHKFLIEKASRESRVLYLFVVEEDKSSFPFEIRWKLIEKGIAHLDNVVMLKSSHYVVSGTIFPSYFLKNQPENEISMKQAELDIQTFIRYIVPILGITRRYVGTEDYCKTTLAYNNAMKKLLPKSGVELVEVPRIKIDSGIENQGIVSASKIRAAIKNDQLQEVFPFLPEVTKDFLLSSESEEIKQKIKEGEGRH